MAYKLYIVAPFKILPGKGPEGKKWWTEKGAPAFASKPWIKSMRCYGLALYMSTDCGLEVWCEIENFAAMDAIDSWFAGNPKEAKAFASILRDGEEYIEWGQVRLMADWPESSLSPD
jgi:hypothetical protein